jgi:hypothetical protein
VTDIRTAGQELQEQVLDTIRKSQDAIVDALKAWADTAQSITPSLPALHPPFADKLPKPEELAGNAYDFAEQLLASQRKFAEDVLQVAGSVTAKKSDAPKKSATPDK